MSLNLDIALTILVWVFIIFLVALGYLVSMCLLELHKSLVNLTEISRIYKDDAKPVLDELKSTLVNVKKMTTASNSSLNILKSAVTGMLGAGALMLGNLKGKGGFIDGLLSGFKLFKK
ncbi:hypothetical protein IKQ26_06305 [bacterium]|nr:hypothetical protein [bacterium]